MRHLRHLRHFSENWIIPSWGLTYIVLCDDDSVTAITEGGKERILDEKFKLSEEEKDLAKRLEDYQKYENWGEPVSNILSEREVKDLEKAMGGFGDYKPLIRKKNKKNKKRKTKFDSPGADPMRQGVPRKKHKKRWSKMAE